MNKIKTPGQIAYEEHASRNPTQIKLTWEQLPSYMKASWEMFRPRKY